MAAFTRFIFITYLLGLVHKAVIAEQCNGPRQLPIWGKMLKGHIYDKRSTRSGYAECLHVCRNEDICQSFNFVISESACELNNRTKEACPSEDFVPDQDRYYVKLDVNRVPLGSIRELPAKSCQEINANEGRKMPSDNYWFYSLIPGKSVLADCDMSNEDIDECSAVPRVCSTNGVCKNSVGSFDCSCKAGYTGNGTTCSDIDECADNSHGCDVNAVCTNNQGSYSCACKPAYYGNGKSCMNTRGLHASTILGNNGGYRVQLALYLDPVVQSSVRSKFVRCWHATTDSWAASTFHNNCDGKGPTVTIIQVDKYIFGGYSDVSWSSSCGYASSSKAFIFSLYNKNSNGQSRYNPVKQEVKPSQYSNAIYRCSSYGPIFGGGWDIYISNYAASNGGHTYCGSSYPLPPGYSNYGGQCTFYAGSYTFTPTDVEVFYETTT